MLLNLLRQSAKIVLSAATYLYDTLLLRGLRLMPRQNIGKLALVVRLDQTGDFILWLPSAHRLCAHLRARGFRVVGAVNAPFAEFAQACDLFDEVVPINRKRMRLDPLYRTRLFAGIYRRGFAEAIQPVWSRELTVGDAIVRVSNAPLRVGWSGDDDVITPLGRWFGNLGYNRLLSAPDELVPELDRNEDFLGRLGIAGGSGNLPTLPLVGLARFALPERYILLVPGASFSGRRWPARRFAEVAASLFRDYGLPAVICGVAHDRGLAERIAAQADMPTLDLTGRTDLREFSALIKAARLVISNDTASVHIAALVGTPSVCIAGGGHFGRFIPYGASGPNRYLPPRGIVHRLPCFQCNWQCTFPREEERATRCVSAVTVAEVLDASRAALMEARV